MWNAEVRNARGFPPQCAILDLAGGEVGLCDWRSSHLPVPWNAQRPLVVHEDMRLPTRSMTWLALLPLAACGTPHGGNSTSSEERPPLVTIPIRFARADDIAATLRLLLRLELVRTHATETTYCALFPPAAPGAGIQE